MTEVKKGEEVLWKIKEITDKWNGEDWIKLYSTVLYPNLKDKILLLKEQWQKIQELLKYEKCSVKCVHYAKCNHWNCDAMDRLIKLRKLVEET